MKERLRELERLTEVEKILPFVPPGEYAKAKAELNAIKDVIEVLMGADLYGPEGKRH